MQMKMVCDDRTLREVASEFLALKKEQKVIGECIACGKLTYNNIMRNPYAPPVARYPYCNSTNRRKISTLSKAGSVAMWGVFALGKASKE